ncbi:hypothetical protein [Taibaiella soli]|uniref:DUF2780 domain-containing protein n=1 Tax=Taibaiella soli TaxID=1649169 RepID=A0A2W2BK62_9BACT|nr:hypothetical protein [Taibaiella soli]PZF73846.1 hypothetical protein DN068_05755 [Taibaiella soli]
MKKLILFLALSCFVATGVNAQVDLNSMASKATGTATNVENTAKALGELANGIAPGALNSSWLTNKTSWLKGASTVTSASGAGKLLGQLGGFLKPSATKSGFDLSKWISTANTLKSFSGVGSSIKSLLGGMNASSLTSSFLKNKDTYMSLLNTLK